MRILKKLIILLSVPLFIVVAAYFYGVYQNNRDVPYPQQTQIQISLEQSIQWLLNHEAEVLTQANPMLWWMLFEVHKISADERIGGMLEKYQQRYSRIKHSVWGPLFDGRQQTQLGAYAVQGLPYYNQHLIYALNCAVDIADESILVSQQNQADFCHQPTYIYRPACITHQLMGINFLSTKQCNLLPNIDEVRQSLQQDIATQLTWDIRVVDVYLQRVLMLLITGKENSVKPMWIQQVLDHQLTDGGWGNFDVLLDNGARSIGFSSRVISVGQARSDFHATAQGIYIMSVLLAAKQAK